MDGKALATAIKKQIAQKAQQRLAQGLRAPGLAVILVGEDPASEVYVRHKQKACEQVGVTSHCLRLGAHCSETDIAREIQKCNNDPLINGILLQLPLPAHIHSDNLLKQIAVEKDVDGFHPYHIGQLALRTPSLRPCTPQGIMRLLATTGVALKGLHAVVVGASNIVGRPMALELLLAGCTTTVCHRFTKNLDSHTAQADVLIAAVGKVGIIDSLAIKPGALVVDVGIHRQQDGSLVGDIDFETACQKAAWITPVPGGVGPMTVAMLLENTLLAASQH